MIETRSSPKPREGAGLWLFKIVAGFMIVILLGVHFVVNHLIATTGLLNYVEIVTYYTIPIVPFMEITFLVFVIAHALVGMRSILLDLNPSDKVLRVADIIFWLAGIGFSIYGIWLVWVITQRA